MAQGNYDHPSYLTRQLSVLGNSTAGNAGTSLITNFPSAIKLRNLMMTVLVAGTSAGTGHKIDVFVNTSSVGTVSLNTLTAGQTATTGDLNTSVAAGTQIYFKNGTDATGTAKIVAEYHIDPAVGTWS